MIKATNIWLLEARPAWNSMPGRMVGVRVSTGGGEGSMLRRPRTKATTLGSRPVQELPAWAPRTGSGLVVVAVELKTGGGGIQRAGATGGGAGSSLASGAGRYSCCAITEGWRTQKKRLGEKRKGRTK